MLVASAEISVLPNCFVPALVQLFCKCAYVRMAGEHSGSSCLTLEERLAALELGSRRMTDYVVGWPLHAVENANSREILDLKCTVDDLRKHVPNIPTASDRYLSAGNLSFEDRIKALEVHLGEMRNLLRSSPLRVVEAANALAISDLSAVVFEIKDHVRRVTAGSALSPYGCNCPNGFNAPRVQKLVQDCGAQLRKMDELRRDIRAAVSETTGRLDLVQRLLYLIEDEEDNFEDYEPPVPSPYDDYSYDSDRSPKGAW